MRYATAVWDVDPAGKTDEAVAAEGLDRMEAFMKDIGVAMGLKELGVTEDMVEGIADASFILNGGYKVLTHGDIVAILRESLK